MLKIITITLITSAASLMFSTAADAQIINTLRGFEDSEPGWSGNIAGSIALAEGNTDYFEFELDGKLQYQTTRHRFRAIGLHMHRTASGVEIAEARLGHLRHNYRLWQSISTVAFVQGQYNPFLRLESRTLFGAGLRFDFFEREIWKAAGGIAIMHETERLTDDLAVAPTDEVQESTSRYRYSLFLTLYGTTIKGTKIDLWGFYQPIVDDLKDARSSAAASLRVDIVGELYLLVSYVVRYDSSPPEGVEDLDYLLRSGLSWEF
jgi:hypothetical protein